MAIYSDLRLAAEDPGLRTKVAVAITIKCAAILTESTGTNLANRQTWAAAALASPDSFAQRVVNGVVAINAGAANLAIITGANDAAVQGNVNTVVDVLANYGA